MGLVDMVQNPALVPTYCIQIQAPGRGDDIFYSKVVQNQPLYVSIKRYQFGDVWPGYCPSDEVMFRSHIANAMIDDFIAGRSGCDELRIHCSRGRNRSPAVGMAFNHIFNLGHNYLVLRDTYPEFNFYVYKTLVEAGARRGLCSQLDIDYERHIDDAASKSLFMQGAF